MRLFLYCSFLLRCCQLFVWFGLAEGHGDADPNENTSSETGEEHHNDGGDHHEKKAHHEDHTNLINSLLEHYDSSSSPTHGQDEPTIINVNVQLLSLDDISDTRMELIIDTRFTFSWSDSRLMTPECKYEKEDCDDHFDMKTRLHDLWTPDLYILNSRIARHHDQPLRNGMVYLVASGQVFLSKRLTLTLRCPMNLVLYPLDTQRCPLLICPYSLTENELLLNWTENGVGLLDDIQDGQNKFVLLTPITTGHMKLKYNGPDVSGYFSCVNATFSLHRQNGYHIGYSYTVTSFIVIVSWIAFWLPVTAVPARVTLGVTTLLTLLTTGNFVRSSLPPISYVTAIDVWVGLCTVFVFMALLLFPVSHYFSHRHADSKIHPRVKSRMYPIGGKCSVCGKTKIPNCHNDTKNGLDVDNVCRKLFPLLFLSFNIAYWGFYIPRSMSS